MISVTGPTWAARKSPTPYPLRTSTPPSVPPNRGASARGSITQRKAVSLVPEAVLVLEQERDVASVGADREVWGDGRVDAILKLDSALGDGQMRDHLVVR